MHKALCSEYETAIDDAFSKTVAKSCSQIEQDFLSVSPTLASTKSWQIKLDNIYKSAAESVSEWTLCPSDREVLLEPIRTLGDALTQELVRFYQHGNTILSTLKCNLIDTEIRFHRLRNSIFCMNCIESN